MVAMRMAAQKNFDVFKFETNLLNRILNRWYISFENRIDQNVPLRSSYQERRETFRPNVVNVSDDFMRWKLFVLLFVVTNVAREEILNCQHARSLLREKK